MPALQAPDAAPLEALPLRRRDGPGDLRSHPGRIVDADPSLAYCSSWRWMTIALSGSVTSQKVHSPRRSPNTWIKRPTVTERGTLRAATVQPFQV